MSTTLCSGGAGLSRYHSVLKNQSSASKHGFIDDTPGCETFELRHHGGSWILSMLATATHLNCESYIKTLMLVSYLQRASSIKYSTSRIFDCILVRAFCGPSAGHNPALHSRFSYSSTQLPPIVTNRYKFNFVTDHGSIIQTSHHEASSIFPLRRSRSPALCYGFTTASRGYSWNGGTNPW